MNDPHDKEPGRGAMLFSICVYCLHGTNKGTCIAYPDGIPFRILAANTDYLTVQPDQTGDAVFVQNPALPLAPHGQWNA